MGVYIKGMEMPTSCSVCDIKVRCFEDVKNIEWLTYHPAFYEERLTNCPLAEAPKWVPVTEQLPEYMENVLVTDGVFSGMGWRDYYDCHGTKPREDYWIAPSTNVNELGITHWMPLPEPPESDGE